MKLSIHQNVFLVSLCMMGLSCGGQQVVVDPPMKTEMTGTDEAERGAILDPSPHSESIGLLIAYPTGILNGSASDRQCGLEAIHRIPAGSESLLTILERRGLTPRIHLDALHSTIYFAVPLSQIPEIKSLMETLHSGTRLETLAAPQACSAEKLKHLIKTDFHPREIKLFIAAPDNFPISEWDDLSPGNKVFEAPVSTSQEKATFAVARSNTSESVFTVHFAMPGATARDLATGDVTARTLCLRIGDALRADPPRIKRLECRTKSLGRSASLMLRVAFEGPHQAIWSDLLDTIRMTTTLPISTHEVRNAARMIRQTVERRDTSPEKRLSRLAQFWARHDRPIYARKQWDERIQELAIGDIEDRSMVEWVSTLSDSRAMEAHLLIHEEDPSIDLAFIGESLQDSLRTRWASQDSVTGTDRVSTAITHHHGPDYRSDIFEIRFRGGRTQANGTFAGAADLTAAVLRQSIPEAMVLTTETDLRIRIVTRPVDLPDVLIKLRNAIRGLQSVKPGLLERARQDALRLMENRTADAHAQFEDHLHRLGLQLTQWHTADWSSHIAHLKNAPLSVIKPWARRYVMDAQLSIAWVGPTALPKVRDALRTVFGRQTPPVAGLSRASSDTQHTSVAHVSSDTPRHGRVYGLTDLSPIKIESLALMEDIMRVEMNAILGQKMDPGALRIFPVAHGKSGYLGVHLRQGTVPLIKLVHTFESALDKIRQIEISRTVLDDVRRRRTQSVLSSLSNPENRVQWMNDRSIHEPRKDGKTMLRTWRVLLDGLTPQDILLSTQAIFTSRNKPTLLQGITGTLESESHPKKDVQK